MTEKPPPRRVRVTADDDRSLTRADQSVLENDRSLSVSKGALPAPAHTHGIALPGAPSDDADAVYARALRRSQLRLALGTVAGFVVVTAVLTFVIALVPEIDRLTIVGLPLSWILHAFAFYPIIIVFALLYARGAARNERAYRMLREHG